MHSLQSGTNEGGVKGSSFDLREDASPLLRDYRAGIGNICEEKELNESQQVGECCCHLLTTISRDIFWGGRRTKHTSVSARK